jgi:hypothetical protein
VGFLVIQLLLCRLSVVAAAAKNYDYRKDYNPSAVIVKKVAQAVVIHICYS